MMANWNDENDPQSAGQPNGSETFTPKLEVVTTPTGKHRWSVELRLNGQCLYQDELKGLSQDARKAWASKALDACSKNVRQGITEADLADQVWKQIQPQLLDESARSKPRNQPKYRATAEGFIYHAGERQSVPVRISNFTARIVKEIHRKDGGEHENACPSLYEIEVTYQGRTYITTVPADQFDGMGWLCTGGIPSTASIAGDVTKARSMTAEAIRLVSQPVTQDLYTHLGWRKIGGKDVYLTRSGALGTAGLDSSVQVELPRELSGYRLDSPPTGEALKVAIRASLDFAQEVTTEPHRVLPILASIYHAPLGRSRAIVYAQGKTNTFKTSVMLAALSHYGPAMLDLVSEGQVVGYAGTTNAIQKLGYLAKDIPLLIDDFKLTGNEIEDRNTKRLASVVMHDQANGTGRQRLNRNSELMETPMMRCSVLSTGEDSPTNMQSTDARMLILRFRPGVVIVKPEEGLSKVQKKAADGLYSQAMAAYVQYLAGDLAGHRARLAALMLEYRKSKFQGVCELNRVVDGFADLAAAYRLFLDFAQGVGAVDAEKATERMEKVVQAFKELAKEEAPNRDQADPATRFVELVKEALAAGVCHLTDPEGRDPNIPGTGWITSKDGGQFGGRETMPRGNRIGWIRPGDKEVILLPQIALSEVAKLNKNALTLQYNQLGTQLLDAGLIRRGSEKDRSPHLARVMCGGQYVRGWVFEQDLFGLWPAPDTKEPDDL